VRKYSDFLNTKTFLLKKNNNIQFQRVYATIFFVFEGTNLRIIFE